MRIPNSFYSFAAMLLVFCASGSVSASTKKVLVVRKGSPAFDQVFKEMKAQLDPATEVVDYVYSKGDPYEPFKQRLIKEDPALAVVMDNDSVEFLKKFNEENPKKISGVALMGLNLKRTLKGNKQISGIAFETPAYSMVTQFRYVVNKPVKNVLVLYRKSEFQEEISETEKLLSGEKIRLHAFDVESEGSGGEAVSKYLEKNLNRLLASSGEYDVLWLLLDSVLLSQENFLKYWLPAVRANSMPIVVGTEKFVDPKMDFAVFAVSPDLRDLGGQAAQMVDTALNSKAGSGTLGVEEVLGVQKVIDMKRVDKIGLGVKKENLSEVRKAE